MQELFPGNLRGGPDPPDPPLGSATAVNPVAINGWSPVAVGSIDASNGPSSDKTAGGGAIEGTSPVTERKLGKSASD